MMRLLPLLIFLAFSREPDLSLKVAPLVSFAPHDVRLTVRVQPDAHNRQLCAQVTSDTGEDLLDCQTLEGERAKITYELWFKHLSAGNYEAQAYVVRSDTSAKFTTLVPFQVLGAQ